MKLSTAVAIGLSTLSNLCLAQNTSDLCDARCQGTVALGVQYERDSHADNTFAFYDSPANFSSSLAPGSLLKVEVATNLVNHTVPNGLTMSRIIYATENINGTTIPASAYILWPYTPLDHGGATERKQGYSMIAWAHGTSGLFRACAPSNYRALQYHFMVPFALALQGIVVVAPDYAGLGVAKLPNGDPIRHPWAAGPLQANDLAHAVTAARAAFPDVLRPSGPFVAMGHSQGGNAAWGFAERQAVKPLAGYRGTVTFAPPIRYIDQLEDAKKDPSNPVFARWLGLVPKLIAAATNAFPGLNYSGLTPLGLHRWLNVLAPVEGCLPTDTLAFNGLNSTQLLEPGWDAHPSLKAFASLTRGGGRALAGPMLVLLGDKDSIVSVKHVEGAVDETCAFKGGRGIEMVTYENAGHFPLIQATQGRWMDWVKAKLRGPEKGEEGVCSKKTVTGLRAEFNKPNDLPNFLVTWASQSEGYKYIL